MNTLNTDHLASVALRVREHILRMSSNGGAFTGASLSCADILVYLYYHVLNISPDTLHDPNRDYLLLSKGHDVPALYGVLTELGYFPPERLQNHLSASDSVYWHPNRAIPGVEFHSGSLGHLLSVGLGIAYDIKLKGGSGKVVVILGDGELNEGSIWEACLTASAHNINNLLAIVDRNHFQANLRTEDLIPLEPLAPKFEAFGWKVFSADGHDFESMHSVLGSWKPCATGSPTVVIANTQRGHGVPSIAERADRWFCNFSEAEVQDLILELHGEAQATITSETLIVR